MENNADNVSLLEMPELAELVASTPAVERLAGETLFQSGDLCTTLPLVVSGSARIYARDNNGHQVTLYGLKPGDVCPISLSILLHHGSYPASAIAETDTLVRYLSGEDLKAIIHGTPEVFRAFLNTLADGLYDSAFVARQLTSATDDSHADTTAERAAQR